MELQSAPGSTPVRVPSHPKCSLALHHSVTGHRRVHPRAQSLVPAAHDWTSCTEEEGADLMLPPLSALGAQQLAAASSEHLPPAKLTASLFAKRNPPARHMFLFVSFPTQPTMFPNCYKFDCFPISLFCQIYFSLFILLVLI